MGDAEAEWVHHAFHSAVQDYDAAPSELAQLVACYVTEYRQNQRAWGEPTTPLPARLSGREQSSAEPAVQLFH